MNNRRRTGHEPITSLKDAIKELPYGFVPIADTKAFKEVRVPLDAEDDSLITGSINCEMYALNDLCVGNQHHDLGNEKVEIAPLMIDGKIVIPSSTLKGCFAGFLAASLGLPISRMNNRLYGFRPNNAPSGNRVANYAGIIESIAEDNTITVKRFEERYYAFTKYAYPLGHASLQKYNDTNNRGLPLYKYQIRNDGAKSNYFYFYPYHDGLDGEGTLGSLAERPATHKCFGVMVDGSGKVPAFAKERYTISPECYAGYLTTITYLQDEKEGHLQDHRQKKNICSNTFAKNVKKNSGLKVGDLIFFEVLTTAKTQIITFGKHYRYRWAFSRSLHDFIKDFQAEDAESIKLDMLNRIEEMFGYSSSNPDIPHHQRAKSAKVHFSCAVHEAGTGSFKELWLPRAGAPKPSSYEFYLKENFRGETQDLLTTYGDPAREDNIKAPRLSGRKLYYRTKRISSVPESEGMIKLSKVLSPNMHTLPKFNFRVYFENLRPIELELLCYALNLGQNITPTTINMDDTKPVVMISKSSEPAEPLLCHQIGYGKNHGMGAVKVAIEEKDVKPIVHRIKRNPESGMLADYHRSATPSTKRLKENPCLYDLCKLYKEAKKYPRLDSEIFAWHTSTKNNDLKNRKK
jgi:CRISPR-associated protein (TIGR03986 family)